MFKRISIIALLVGLFVGFAGNCFAVAAITPDATYQDRLGSCRLITAYFSAATADDGDTWASGLATHTPPIAYWTADTDNPTTQTSVGVAVAYSAGTFTFYPAEDNKPFYLFVLVRN